ncbi:hypothetical protein MBLNU457_4676t1 [Dothideomycetes sp. NU457]
MINGFQHTISAAKWQRVKATLMDSLDLKFDDNTFTTSITNFSTTNVQNPPKMFAEVHRTLQPDGLAMFLQWKRFTVADMILEAQRSIRSDVTLMKVPKVEYMQYGHILSSIKNAGFRHTEQRCLDVLVTGEQLEGLREFMLGGFTKEARSELTEEEQARWPSAIDEAIQREVSKNGGVKMEAWVVTGRKW